MKRLVGALALSATLLLGTAAVSVAVTHGELDGNGHPYVGLMVAQDAAGKPLWRCSGTLIAPTVFLTAGHCTESPAAHVEIWFDADMQTTSRPRATQHRAGGWHAIHPPAVRPDAFWQYDLGIVVLDEPVALAEYGALPAQDQLDGYKTKRGMQEVGSPRSGTACR